MQNASDVHKHDCAASADEAARFVAPVDDARRSASSGDVALTTAAPGSPAYAATSPAAGSRAEIDALAARLTAAHSDTPDLEGASRNRPRKWRSPHPPRETAAAAPAAEPFAPFIPQLGHCETHGPYALNARDADGTVRWHTPGCAACRRASAALGLMRRAAIAPRFAQCGFDNFDATTDDQRRALERCREYADDFTAMREHGTCLILRGAPGTGKNHLATAIARSVLARGCTVLNATAHEIIGRVREGWGRVEGAPRLSEREVIAEFAALDLLIIDEVGRAYRSRDGADSIELFNVIDARYRRLAPTLVISNLDREGIRAALGAAAYDRLREGGGKLANFDWSSHRGPVADPTET